MEKQNGVILGYNVIMHTLDTNESRQLETVETFLEVTGLHPFYLYEVMVAAETSVGLGPYSNPVNQQLTPAS